VDGTDNNEELSQNLPEGLRKIKKMLVATAGLRNLVTPEYDAEVGTALPQRSVYFI
jgi:hypothetical protein